MRLISAPVLVSFIVAAAVPCAAQSPGFQPQPVPRPPLPGGVVPDLLYYTFDEGPGATTTANLAVPGAGSPNAPIVGHTMNNPGLSGTGFTGTSAFSGNINTGWVPSFGQGSWTMAFWLDVTLTAAIPNFYWLFGEFSTNQLAAAVLNNDVRLSSTVFPDVVISGGADPNTPRGIAFVYDAGVPEIRGYLDGALVVTVPTATLTMNGSGFNAFAIGAVQVVSTFAANAVLDEFRVYSRAVSESELLATWNVSVATVAVPGEWQLNQAGAQLSVDMVQSFGFGPAVMSRSLNTWIPFHLSSTNTGLPWDLAFTVNPMVSLSAGALTAPDGQIVNLDITDPTFSTWFDQMTTSPGFTNISTHFFMPVAQNLSVQAATVDPTTVSGLALSQGTRVRFQ